MANIACDRFFLESRKRLNKDLFDCFVIILALCQLHRAPNISKDHFLSHYGWRLPQYAHERAHQSVGREPAGPGGKQAATQRWRGMGGEEDTARDYQREQKAAFLKA